MKLNFRVFVFLLIISFSSCDKIVSTIDKKKVVTEKPIKKNKKFVYVLYLLKSPKLFHTDDYWMTRTFPTGGTYEERVKGINTVTWEDRVYVSKIKEYEGFSEDDKYKLLDEVEDFFKLAKYPIIDIDYQNSLSQVPGYAKSDELMRHKTKIIEQKVLVYNSYAEASKSKRVRQNR